MMRRPRSKCCRRRPSRSASRSCTNRRDAGAPPPPGGRGGRARGGGEGEELQRHRDRREHHWAVAPPHDSRPAGAALPPDRRAAALARFPGERPSGRAAIQIALRSIDLPRPEAARLVLIPNTLHLERLWVSESLLPALVGQPGIAVGPPRPWDFTAGGDLAHLPRPGGRPPPCCPGPRPRRRGSARASVLSRACR